jgi:hypothetical protein
MYRRQLFAFQFLCGADSGFRGVPLDATSFYAGAFDSISERFAARCGDALRYHVRNENRHDFRSGALGASRRDPLIQPPCADPSPPFH